MEFTLEDDYQQEFEGGRLLINTDIKNSNYDINDITQENILEMNANNIANDSNDWKYNIITPISQCK